MLRPLQDSDLDFLEGIENNSVNWQFGSENKRYSKKELLDYIANATKDISIAMQYRFVIDLKNTPIGFIDLFDYHVSSASVGIIIAKDFRKRGFAKQALTLLTNYAFLILGVSQLNAIIKRDNLSSIKLFTSCSFELQTEKIDLQYFIKLAKN